MSEAVVRSLPVLVVALALLLPMVSDQVESVEHEADTEPSLQVDPHQSDGQTVVVARATLNTTGWMVIHADDGGSPGEVLGNSTLLQSGETIGIEVPVTLDADTNETVRLHAMLHLDDGDGTYDFPDGDPPLTGSDGNVVNTPFTVQIGDAMAVVATGDTEMTDSGVTVQLAHLASPGYMVLHLGDGGPGAVVGNSDLLQPGAHNNITIDVDRSALPDDTDNVTLWAMIHLDDGNGTYDFPQGDPPVVVDGVPVMTPFDVRIEDVGEEAPGGDESPGPSPSPTPSPDDEDEPTPGVGAALLIAVIVAFLALPRIGRGG